MSTIFDHRNSLLQKRLFIVLGCTIGLSIVASMVFNQILWLGIPLLGLILFIGIVDFHKLFYLLYATIPISIAIEVGGGFSTDLPTEPLLIGLSAVAIFHILSNSIKGIDEFIKHPITIVLLVHITWTFISTINSDYTFIGIKFFLAKLWYILPCYFLAGFLLNNRGAIYKFFLYSWIPMAAIILISLLRHSAYEFSFVSINTVMGPWFINHVMYAATIVVIFPMLITWLFYRDQPNHLKFPKVQWILKLALIGLFLVGTFHSFTRAAMLSLFIAGGAYLVIKWRLVRHSLIGSFVILILGLAHLSDNNEYLEYAPEYTKAISHHSFDRLVQATSQLEDVSTMERVYRWVAGFRMISDRPVVGFGPGSFYSSYQPYAVTNFKTYVSHNFDKSGIHCYFLMVFVEQGIVGGIIFLIFTILLLVRGERTFHLSSDKFDRAIIMAALIGLVIINALILINDLLETDKIGPFYFTYAAILVLMDLKTRRTIQKNNLIQIKTASK